MYAMLRGEPLPDVDADERPTTYYEVDDASRSSYNAAIPPETFDLDHRR